MISRWRHPIKYLRLVTTPTCDTCRNNGKGSRPGEYREFCMSKRYLEHEARLLGVSRECAPTSLVRGTRWCDFEPIEDDADE